LNSPDFAGRNKAVAIEDYVWIGTRAMILPGVSIAKGAVVAAGSVVSKDVEPFQVVGGVPAKLITIRNSELRYKLAYQRLFQ
jgi:acetyltransferase-like isoleucine patch superfamily enzyme